MMIITISPLIFGCSEEKTGGWSEDTRTVLTVAGNKVTWDEFRYFYMNYKRDYDGGDASYWDENPESEADLMDDVLDILRENYAIRSMAKEFGVSLTSEEKKSIDDEIAGTIEHYGGEEGYRAALGSYYMTGDCYRMTLELRDLEIKLRKYVTDEFTGNILSDDKTVDEDIHRNFIRVKHILIVNEENDDPDANFALAEELRQRAENGEDFDSLVRSYNEDTALDLENGYYFTRGEFLEAFEDAAFELEVGEVSDVVETVNGFHVIKRYELDDDYINDYFEELREVFKARRFNEQQDEVADELELEYSELFDTISIKTMK